MTQAIRHVPRYHGPTIYHKPGRRYSAVRQRGVTPKLEMPLNMVVAIRIHSKAHTWACHSPAFNQKLHANMIAWWDKKFHREKVSVKYINTYTMHRFM